MKARQLIDGCSFGLEALKATGQAFDNAWQEIAGNFGSAAGRLRRRVCTGERLAVNCQRGHSQRGGLERAALERMALDYKDRLGGSRR